MNRNSFNFRTPATMATPTARPPRTSAYLKAVNAGATTMRRFLVKACVVLFITGLAANVMTVLSAWRNRDAELIRSLDDVRGLISRAYEFRQATGEYPRSLAELRPIAGDVISNHVKNNLRDDNDFCASWCWTYLHRGDVRPPILRRYVGDHGYLMYEFSPSSGYCYPKNVDEGWVITSEGSKRYLRSFFHKNDGPSARRDR